MSRQTSDTQHPTPNPRSYTPRHLAEKILNNRAALEGERKQVTVLFADVKGSMELAEQLDSEEWHNSKIRDALRMDYTAQGWAWRAKVYEGSRLR